MIGGLANLASAVVEGVSGYFGKREERRLAGETGKAKLAQAKVDGKHEISMSRAEWEAVAIRASDNSWKDEFWTVVLAGPFIMLIVGSFGVVFVGDDRLLVAANLAIENIAKAGIEYGYVLGVAVLAAFGVRFRRKR